MNTDPTDRKDANSNRREYVINILKGAILLPQYKLLIHELSGLVQLERRERYIVGYLIIPLQDLPYEISILPGDPTSAGDRDQLFLKELGCLQGANGWYSKEAIPVQKFDDNTGMECVILDISTDFETDERDSALQGYEIARGLLRFTD